MRRSLIDTIFSREGKKHRKERRKQQLRKRRLQLESLEDRALLAADVYVNDTWNLVDDVDNSGTVTAGDVVNDLSAPAVTYTLDDGSGTVGDAYGVVTTGAATGYVSGANTIASAVSAVDVGGNVNVLAGTYDETLVLGKSVNLLGANAGVHPAVGTSTTDSVGTRGPETILSHNGFYAISPRSDNITIDGFEFNGAGSRVIDSSGPDANGLHITNNIFDNTSTVAGQGVIQIVSGSHSDMVVDFNAFHNTGGAASFLAGGAAGTGNFDGLQIANNLFNGQGNGVFWGSDIPLVDGVVSQNEFDGTIGGTPGVGGVGLNIGKAGNIAIQDNYFHDLLGTSLQVGMADGSITGNTFAQIYANGGSGDALQLWGGEYGTTVSTNVTIANNVIHYNDVVGAADPTHGLRLRPSGGGPAIDASTIHVNDNTFLNGGVRSDAFAIRNQGDPATAVDASGNWWDSTDENVIAALMQGLVDFTPFLDSGTDTDPLTPGFQGDFSVLHVTSLGAQTGSLGRIQEGINLVTPGGTVIVGDGTYDESPNVNKSLTLESLNGRSNTIINLQTGPTYLGSLTIGGQDVTVDGFTIVGRDAVGSGLAASNVLVNTGLNDVKLLNNLLQVGQIGSGSNGDDGMGLLTSYTTTPANFVQSLEVTGNIFEPLSGSSNRAFYINPGVSNFTFQDNQITGTFNKTAITQASSGLVDNNVVTGDGTSAGLGTWGYPDANAYGQTTFSANTITQTADAITVYDTNNVSIENNTLDNNGTAVGLVETGYVATPLDASTVTIYDNSITGASTAVDNGYSTGAANASGNWWGTTDENTIAGLMSGAVDFTPYLASGTDTDGGTAGFQGDFSTLYVSALGAQVQAGGRINEAIGLVTGSTVIVNDGTYNEDVLVNINNLDLHSVNGAAVTTINGQGTGYTGAVRTAGGVQNFTFGGSETGFTVNGAGQAGVLLGGNNDGGTIEDNVINAAAGKNALLTEGGQTNHTIQGNTFGNVGGDASQLVYINGNASVAVPSNNVDFLNNQFTGTASGPLLGQEADDSLIQGNTFTGATGYAGVEMWGDNNTLNDDTLSGTGTGAGLLVHNTASTFTLNDSSLDGYASGGSITGVATVNWTTTDQPDNVLVDGQASQISASGDKVVQAIDFSGVTNLNVDTGDGDDTVTVSPSATTVINLNGNIPNPPLTPPAVGDTLIYVATGAPFLFGPTTITTSGLANINYQQFENYSVSGPLVINGTDGDDTLVVNATGPDSGTYQLTTNGVAGLVVPFSGATSLSFNGGLGDDQLIINNPVGGLFNPSGGINYDGGTGGEGSPGFNPPGDTLEILGGAATSVEHESTNDHDGFVYYNGAGSPSISYTGLEPITDTITATSRTFTFTGGAQTITLSDDGGAGDHMSLIDSSLGESVNFLNPTGLLTINSGSGDDTINVLGLDSLFTADLTINGDAGTNTVDFQAATSTGNLIVNAETIMIGAAISTGADDQTYNGAAIIAADVTLTGNNVTFNGTLDDDGDSGTGSALTVNADGVTRFAAAVGGVHPLDSLHTDPSGKTVFGPAVAPAGGATLNFDASADTDGNSRWEGVSGNTNFDFALDSSVTRQTGVSALPGIEAAYSFPGGEIDNNAGGAQFSVAGTSARRSLQNLPGDPSNNSASWEMWFKPATLPLAGARQVLFEDGGGTGISFSLDGSDLVMRKLPSNVGGNPIEIRYDISSIASEFIQVVGSYNVGPNPDQMEMFVNGVSVGGPQDVGNNGGDWTGGDASAVGTRGGANMGGYGNGSQNVESYEGQIAIFRFYERILSPAEVTQNYSAVTTATTPVPFSVTTIGGQTYGDGVNAGTAVSFVSTGGGDITFDSTLDGAAGSDVAVDTSGATIFNGPVGAASPLESLTTDAGGTTQINGGQVVTSGDQNYGDPVTISGATSIQSSNLTFQDTLDADDDLTVNSQTTHFAGPVSIAGNADINTAGLTFGDTLDVGGNLVVNSGAATFTAAVNVGGATNIDSSGAINFGSTLTTGDAATIDAAGNATFQGAVVLGGDTNLIAGGNATFNSTIDSAASENNALMINAGGVAALDGAIGGADALSSLQVSAAGRTELGGGTINLNGDSALFAGPVLLTADLAIAEAGLGDVVFQSTVDSASGHNFNLSVSTAGGQTRFRGDVGADALGALSDDAGLGSVTTNDISFNPLIVPGTPTLNFDAGEDNSATNGWTSTVNPGLRDWNFNGATTNVTHIASPATSLPGIHGAFNFPALGSSDVNDFGRTADYQNFNENTDATWEWWLSAANLTAGQTIWETGGAGIGSSLVLTPGGDILFVVKDNAASAFVSAPFPSDGQFHQVAVVYNRDTTGAVDSLELYVDGALVSSDDSQTLLDSWSGSDDAGLGGRNGAVGGDTGAAGSINYGSFDGQIAIYRFYESTAFSAAQVAANYDAVANGVPIHVVTTGDQNYGGNATLGGDIDLSGDHVTFGGTVDGGHALTVNATSLDFQNTVGGITPLAALTTTTDDAFTFDVDTTVDGDIVTTVNDAASAGQNIVVNSLVTVTSNNGNITLNAGDDLTLPDGSTVAAPAGQVMLNGDYGNADPGVGTTIDLLGTIITTQATATGDTDNDTFNVRPSQTAEITVNGRDPVFGEPGVPPGDTLVFDPLGNTFVIDGNTILTNGGSPNPFQGVNFISIENLTITPLGTDTQKYDMDYPDDNPMTAPGYTSVLTTQVYGNGTPGADFGWDSPVSGASTTLSDPLLNDEHIGTTAHTFSTDLADGAYLVTLTMGTASAIDNVQVAAEGIPVLSGIDSAAFQSVVRSFVVQVKDGTLDLTFSDADAVNPLWAVNAITIRPAVLLTLGIIPPAGSLVGDGTTIDTFGGVDATPNSQITVATSFGSVTSPDVNPVLAGIQVQADATGHFSFDVQRPSTGGQAVLTAEETDGAQTGSLVVNYLTPPESHFDFNSGGSPTAAGYTGVGDVNAYDPTKGYGWLNTASTVDHTGPNDLLQDGHFGTTDNTFVVNVNNGTYTVNVTLGDASSATGPVDVYAEGVQKLSGVTTPTGQFVSKSFQVTVTDGQLDLQLVNDGGSLWELNALDVIVSPNPITITNLGEPVPADGTTIDAFNGSGAAPNSLVTVATSFGTIVNADADPNYAGIQLLTDAGGNFTIDVRRPFVAGTADITAEQVNAASAGSTTQEYTGGSGLRIDLNSAGTPTAAGFIGLGTDNAYNALRGFGWANTASTYSSFGPNALLEDFHYGTTSNTFLADVPTGSYLVNLTMGYQYSGFDDVDVSAEGNPELTGLGSTAGQFITRSFVVNVSDGQLDLQFTDTGGSAFFPVNAIEIYPSPPVPAPITMNGPSNIEADGTSVDAYTGGGASPNSLVTISTDLGTVVSPDASAAYAGIQVMTDASGNFSFDLQRPSSAGTANVSAEEVSGASQGTTTVVYTASSSLNFDFNSFGTPTAAGYTGVGTTNTFDPVAGYGWTNNSATFAVAGPDALLEDFHYGTTSNTFQVAVDPGATYMVTASFRYIASVSGFNVSAEGNPELTGVSVPANTTVVQSFVVTDDGNGLLDIGFDAGSASLYLINALQIVRQPLEAAVAPLADSTAPTLSSDALAPIVNEAIARWSSVQPNAAAELAGVQVQVADLGGSDLGLTSGHQVVIDSNAAGYGWFVDATPHDDSEFDASGNAIAAAAVGHFDLLTVVMHELGHVLGYDDLDPAAAGDSVMDGSLPLSTRRGLLSTEAIDNVMAGTLSLNSAATGSTATAASQPAAEGESPSQIPGLLYSAVDQAVSALNSAASTVDDNAHDRFFSSFGSDEQ